MLIVTGFQTPVGWLEVSYDEHYIHRAIFSEPAPEPSLHVGMAHTISQELNCYFNNPHHRFQLPLKPQGSLYQQKVWNALLVIPVGRTLSYGELAQHLQSSPRAIGQACRTNPIALFIPCHRVVGKNDRGGYMGKAKALNYKLGLLEHEAQLELQAQE